MNGTSQLVPLIPEDKSNTYWFAIKTMMMSWNYV